MNDERGNMKDESEASKNDNLDLRKRTKDFALRIIRLYKALPKTNEARILGYQVLRSGTSIGANFREGVRARSSAEFVSKMENCITGVRGNIVLVRVAVRNWRCPTFSPGKTHERS